MADRMVFFRTSLIDGAAGSLDSIDGTDRGDGDPLQDGDMAFTIDTGILYCHTLDADSSAAENSPLVIRPDTNAGDKRWIQQSIPAAGYLATSDVDDTPVNGVTDAPISSNWAFDHAALQTAHGLVVGTALSDFMVAGADPFAWAKKTLAETKTLLGIDAATSSATGVSELAIASEVNTGTDEGRVITPDAMAGSNFGKKTVQIMVFDSTTDVATGNGKAYFVVPDELTGMNLVRAAASVITAGTTDSTTIAIYNVTDSQEMLSTLMAIETTETSTRTSATPGTIDTTKDDVVTGDMLRIDIDAVSTTAPKGLIVEMVFQLP